MRLLTSRWNLVGRTRAWFSLEWVGEDDLYAQAVSEITPQLFLGCRPSPDGVLDLRRRGVTHVVSCLEEAQRSSVDVLSNEFAHLFLPAPDDMMHELTSTRHDFLTYVDEVMAIDARSKVLVHCEVGVSRSASLVIARVMRDEQLSFLDSYERVRKKRVQVLPNLAFASHLQGYEHELFPENSTHSPSSLAIYLRRYCSVPSDIAEIQAALERNDYDAPAALRSMYGGEIPRVVQGTRSAR